MFIGIAGIIGAGKTTLTQNLADHLGYEAFHEPVHENPYLSDFYRTSYEDTIFARMLHEAGFIDDRDYDTYTGHFNLMKRFLLYPDVIIYLRVTPDVSMKRIAERGRDAEGGITIDYMMKLHQGYEDFASEMGRYTRVLSLDWNEYREPREVARLVQEEMSDNLEFLRDLKRI